MLLCGWWLYIQSIVSGITFPMDSMLQWIIMNQYTDDTRNIYEIFASGDRLTQCVELAVWMFDGN